MHITSPLPLRRDFHVTFDRSTMFWKVCQEYTSHLRDSYRVSKAEAFGLAVEQARMAAVSVIVHGMDGRIQQVLSYDRWMGPRVGV